jgi:hypothetical protein
LDVTGGTAVLYGVRDGASETVVFVMVVPMVWTSVVDRNRMGAVKGVDTKPGIAGAGTRVRRRLAHCKEVKLAQAVSENACSGSITSRRVDAYAC